MASSAFDYPHGVLDRNLPDGTPLPADYALQHPQDYLDVLYHTIPRLLEAMRAGCLTAISQDQANIAGGQCMEVGLIRVHHSILLYSLQILRKIKTPKATSFSGLFTFEK